MRDVLAAQLSPCALAVAPTGRLPASPAETLTLPTFGKVALYAPKGAPDQVVLFVSGDGGWNLGVVSMAERVRDLGALVVGIDIRAFLRSLEASRSCAYPAGALEELSRAVQLHRKLPAYRRPILVGYSSGATLVYAALAAAPPETFAGAISLGFCPDLEIHNAPCRQRGLAFEKKAKGVGYDLAPLPRPRGALDGASRRDRPGVRSRDDARLRGRDRLRPALLAPEGRPRLLGAAQLGAAVRRGVPGDRERPRAGREPRTRLDHRRSRICGLVEVPATGGADRDAHGRDPHRRRRLGRHRQERGRRASPPRACRWSAGAACATTGRRVRPRSPPRTWRESSSTTRRPGRRSASCSSATRSAPTCCRSS